MIHHGDLFDVLPTLAAESIDACVTDPPYGIGFMGREWDTFKPEGVAANTRKAFRHHHGTSTNPNVKGRVRSPAISPSQIEYDRTLAGQRAFQEFTERWSREAFRVLKPGAIVVVCGAPRSHHRMMCGLEDAGFEIRDCFAWLFGQGFPKSKNLGDGKGTALKPAHEPIALAWKPFTGSLTACHQQHGTAALNIDACRIGTDEITSSGSTGMDARRFREGTRPADYNASKDPSTYVGRWPANVLLDDEAAAQLDEQTGELKSGAHSKDYTQGQRSGLYDHGANGYQPKDLEADSGGASRFYYVAKPSRSERDVGFSRNNHPTVKPIALMRWLVRLVTPIGGTVLDPFNGSGTTGIACAHEGRHYIGIEREAEYVASSERRIASAVPLFSPEAAS